jgi:hypothetical protein
MAVSVISTGSLVIWWMLARVAPNTDVNVSAGVLK